MIRSEVLDNGLTIITEGMPHVRSASVGVWLRTGSRHERESVNGISHFIEHLVFKGTEKRTSRDIALIIDSVGGQVDAFTGKEYTCFYTKVLDEHLPIALDLLRDIVLSPRFATDDIEKERKVIYEEIRMVEDSPDELVYDLFSERYWQDHPLGRPIQGTRQSVSRLESRHLLRHFRECYRPENMVIAAAGNLKHREFVNSFGSAFRSLPRGKASGKISPPRATPSIVKKEKKSLEQLHLCIGLPAFSTTSSKRFPLLLLNTLLGGTMSSRLWQRIREGSGLAYSVSSGANSFHDAGFLMIYAATNPATGDLVIRQIVEELALLKKTTVDEKELRVAKDHLKGSLMLSLESSSSRMSNLARQEIYFGRHFSSDEVLRSIEAVTPKQIQALAVELFRGEEAGLAAVGRLDRFRTRRSDLAL
jgi:predicted Zn-dependent peptidase